MDKLKIHSLRRPAELMLLVLLLRQTQPKLEGEVLKGQSPRKAGR
jgi:hypothetical protein